MNSAAPIIPGQAEAEFKQAMLDAGFPMVPDHIVADDEIHRFSTHSDRPRDTSGTYRFKVGPDGIGVGWAMDHRSGVKTRFRNKGATRKLTSHEKAKIEAEHNRRDQEQLKAETKAIAGIRKEYAKSKPAPADHPYFQRKGLTPFLEKNTNLLNRITEGRRNTLLIPCYRPVPGKQQEIGLVTLQRIISNGDKRFAKNCPTVGAFWVIQPAGNKPMQGEAAYIAESIGTALAVAIATDCCVVVAFSAQKLESVAKIVEQRYPGVRWVIAADNDHGTEAKDGSNPGVENAERAARAIGAQVAVPTFAEDDPDTDWLDVMQRQGLDEMRKALEDAIRPVPLLEAPTPGPAPAPHKRELQSLDAYEGDEEPTLGDLLQRRMVTATREAILAKPEPREYIADFFPVRCTSAVVAPGGVGKTLWLTRLCAEHVGEDLHTLILSAEDEAIEYINKLHWMLPHTSEAFESSLINATVDTVADKIHIADLRGTATRLIAPRFGAPGSFLPDLKAVEAIADMIRGRYPKTRLVIVETLSRFAGAESNEAMGALIEACDALAREINGAVVLVHHTGKQQARDGVMDLYAGRGGSTFGDNGRSMVILQRVRKNEKGEWQFPDGLGPVVDEKYLEQGAVLFVYHMRSSYGLGGRIDWFQICSGDGGVWLEPLESATEQDGLRNEHEAYARKQDAAAMRIFDAIEAEGGMVRRRYFHEDTKKRTGMSQKATEELIKQLIHDGYLVEVTEDSPNANSSQSMKFLKICAPFKGYEQRQTETETEQGAELKAGLVEVYGPDFVDDTPHRERRGKASGPGAESTEKSVSETLSRVPG